MDDTVTRLVLYTANSPLAAWVLGSLLLYAVGTNAAWLLRSKGPLPRPYRDWFVELNRFAFYLGVPYLVVGGWPRPPLSGLLSLSDLGFVGIGPLWPVTRWLDALGVGLGLGLAALGLLLLAWVNARRSAASGWLRLPARPWWALVIDALYLQIHWAFYRGASAVILDHIYAGVFLGLALAYLEWSMNPVWRRRWRLEAGAAVVWLRTALALVGALVFLLTRNLWICLGIHWSLELVFWRLGQDQAITPVADQML